MHSRTAQRCRIAGLIVVLAAAILLGPRTASAQTASQFQPPPDNFDWIQLKSGEWLKGELIALYDGSLEFDSDELDNLTLDWDDIQQVRTGRVVQARFRDQAPVTGLLVMEGTTIR